MEMKAAPRKILFTAIGLLAAVGSIVGCGSGSGANGDARGDAAPIKIGLSAPLSGSTASWGTDYRDAAALAIEEINQSGGILGHSIELVAEDDTMSNEGALNVASRLVDEKVIAVLGPLSSSTAMATEQVYSQGGVLMFPPASNPKLTQMGFDNVFRMSPKDDQFGAMDAKVAAERLGAKTAAVIHDNSTYSKGLATYFKDAFEQMGGKVVDFEAITPGEKDYSPVLTKIKSMNPDLFYYSGYYPEGAALVKQGKALGLETQYLMGNSNYDQQFIALAGPAAENVVMETLTPVTMISSEQAQKYVARYKEKYGKEPGFLGHLAYDSVHILKQAIEKAHSLSFDAIKTALRDPGGFQGIAGKITFDKNGDIQGSPSIILTVKNGKFVPYQ